MALGKEAGRGSQRRIKHAESGETQRTLGPGTLDITRNPNNLEAQLEQCASSTAALISSDAEYYDDLVSVGGVELEERHCWMVVVVLSEPEAKLVRAGVRLRLRLGW